MREIIGFNNLPNDFVNFSLRAKLSKRYGLFGRIPMWGGIRLHQFYPPLSTLFVRVFGITGGVIFYFFFTFGIWTYYQNPLVALLFLIGYYHLPSMLYVGRLSEFLGYNFIALAFFNHNPIFSGIFLGFAGLSYPVPFIVGLLILLFKFNFLIYLVAFLVSSWWYIPFLINYRKMGFLKERRKDKFLGLYYMQWASLLNVSVFLLGPLWLKIFFGLGLWFLPVIWKYLAIPSDLEIRGYFPYIKEHLSHFVYRKPFFLSDLPKVIPGLENISESIVFLKQPEIIPEFLKKEDEFSGSLKLWIWACADYLIDKGIIVYNGLPSTEIPITEIRIPQDIKVYSLEEFALK